MIGPLPGGVGVSRLCVYDTVTPDGLPGGTPHLHLCCTEGYIVTGGAGPSRPCPPRASPSTTLRPGAVLWFTPGTVHRLVNGGGLDIVVLMSNTGLPEAGDAVLTFPPEILTDPDRYAAAADLPDGGAPGTDIATAYRRRDLAVEGFQTLRAAVQRDGGRALSPFYDAAATLKRPLLDQWRTRWEDGAGRAAQATGVQLDALARGDATHLRDAHVTAGRGRPRKAGSACAACSTPTCPERPLPPVRGGRPGLCPWRRSIAAGGAAAFPPRRFVPVPVVWPPAPVPAGEFEPALRSARPRHGVPLAGHVVEASPGESGRAAQPAVPGKPLPRPGVAT